MLILAFYSGYLVPLSAVLGYWAGGPWTFATVLWVFGVTFALDMLRGPAPPDRAGARAGGPGASPGFRAIPWILAPILTALVAWAAWAIATQPLSIVEAIGLTVSVGVTTGVIGITTAHEFIHRPGRWERRLGLVLLALVTYMHFRIEHVYGHHRRVATPEDPASARLGESFYEFLPRTLAGGLISAWRIEAARLARRCGRPWGLGNRVARYLGIEAAIYAALVLALGWPAAAFFLAQSAVAVTLLEIVNYLEHYGLERRRLGVRRDGSPRYEPVALGHSWSTGYRVTNWGLFNLGRHADHHLAPGLAYPHLRNFADSPQLAVGYAGSLMLALAPPLWRRVMDPRAARWRPPHRGQGPAVAPPGLERLKS